MSEVNEENATNSIECLVRLKIGRHEYSITEKDIFMDNGNSVQLLTQSHEKAEWGQRPNPILSKRAVKEMSYLKRVQHKHNYYDNVQVFHLANPEMRDCVENKTKD